MRLPNGKADHHSSERSRAGSIAALIADDFYGDGLDLASRGMAPDQPPWLDMPEVKSVHRLTASGDRAQDRAGFRPSVQRSQRGARPFPWRHPTRRASLSHVHCRDGPGAGRHPTLDAGIRLYEDHPDSFDPGHVAGLEVGALGSVLKAARVSRRHGPDSNAWHRIARNLSSGLNSPVSRVIDAGVGDAGELLRDLKPCDDGGRARFPLLRGPKIGPMWIRMMANPGRARIDRIEIIPVAVDVQVRRATENLGVTASLSRTT